MHPSLVVQSPARWLQRRAERARADRIVASLPLYQVALWPDGWEQTEDGGIVVRDTHEIAEARRWYEMAERNGAGHDRGRAPQAAKAMRLHGIGVPRSLVELSGRRFATEQAASVAMRLVANDWVEQRRRMLAADPHRLLGLRAQTWSGSRHQCFEDGAALQGLLRWLLDLCVAEDLVPCATFRLDVRADDGYGLKGWRCRVQIDLDEARRNAVGETIRLALTPWNRQVSRDGKPWPLVSVRVEHPDRPGTRR